jgi:hypothetical protein
MPNTRDYLAYQPWIVQNLERSAKGNSNAATLHIKRCPFRHKRCMILSIWVAVWTAVRPIAPVSFPFACNLIRCKRIYNFRCSMLVLHQLIYVLFTLRRIFMYFLELAY